MVELKPDWPKGYSRLGAAHSGLKQWDDAVEAYGKGASHLHMARHQCEAASKACVHRQKGVSMRCMSRVSPGASFTGLQLPGALVVGKSYTIACMVCYMKYHHSEM